MMFSFWTPNCMYSLAQAIAGGAGAVDDDAHFGHAAAGQSAAFNRPAAEMMAVPCWSSWNTGMDICRESSSSM